MADASAELAYFHGMSQVANPATPREASRGKRRHIVSDYVVALDQGTTSTRAIVFDLLWPHHVARAEGARAGLSASGLGRARPDGDLA